MLTSANGMNDIRRSYWKEHGIHTEAPDKKNKAKAGKPDTGSAKAGDISDVEIQADILTHWDQQSADIKKTALKEWSYLILDDRTKAHEVAVSGELAEVAQELGISGGTITVGGFIAALQKSPASGYRKSEYVTFFLKAAGFTPRQQEELKGVNELLGGARNKEGKVTANCLQLSVTAVSLLRAAGVTARLLETTGNPKALHMQVLIVDKDKNPEAVLDLYDDLNDLKVLHARQDKNVDDLQAGECKLTKKKIYFWDADEDKTRNAAMRVITDLAEERAVVNINRSLVAAKTAAGSGSIQQVHAAAKEARQVLDRYQKDMSAESLWEKRSGTLSKYKEQLGKLAVIKDMMAVNDIGFNPAIHGAINYDTNSFSRVLATADPAKYQEVSDAIDNITYRAPTTGYLSYKDAIKASRDKAHYIQYVTVQGCTQGQTYFIYTDDPANMDSGSVLMEIKCTRADGVMQVPFLWNDTNVFSTGNVYIAKKNDDDPLSILNWDKDTYPDDVDINHASIPTSPLSLTVKGLVDNEDGSSQDRIIIDGIYRDDPNNYVYFGDQELVEYQTWDGTPNIQNVPNLVATGTLIPVEASTGRIGIDPSTISAQAAAKGYKIGVANIYRDQFRALVQPSGVNLYYHPRFTEKIDVFQSVTDSSTGQTGTTFGSASSYNVTMNFDGAFNGPLTLQTGDGTQIWNPASPVSQASDKFVTTQSNVSLVSPAKQQGDPADPSVNPLLIATGEDLDTQVTQRSVVDMYGPGFYRTGTVTETMVDGVPLNGDLEIPAADQSAYITLGTTQDPANTRKIVFNVEKDTNNNNAIIDLTLQPALGQEITDRSAGARISWQLDDGTVNTSSLVPPNGSAINGGANNQYYNFRYQDFAFHLPKEALTFDPATAVDEIGTATLEDGSPMQYVARKICTHKVTYWLEDKNITAEKVTSLAAETQTAIADFKDQNIKYSDGKLIIAGLSSADFKDLLDNFGVSESDKSVLEEVYQLAHGNRSIRRDVYVRVGVNYPPPIWRAKPGIRVFSNELSGYNEMEIITANTLSGVQLSCLERDDLSFSFSDLLPTMQSTGTNENEGEPKQVTRYRISLQVIFNQAPTGLKPRVMQGNILKFKTTINYSTSTYPENLTDNVVIGEDGSSSNGMFGWDDVKKKSNPSPDTRGTPVYKKDEKTYFGDFPVELP